MCFSHFYLILLNFCDCTQIIIASRSISITKYRLTHPSVSYVFLFLFLIGCATDKRPEKYQNSINVSQSLAFHSSVNPIYTGMQRSLGKRNLLVADNGDVLPINGYMCKANLLFHLTDEPFPVYMGQHQDLFSGFYIETAIMQNKWHVVITNNEFNRPKKAFELSFLSQKMTPVIHGSDQLVIRPAPTSTANSINALVLYIKGAFPTTKVTYVLAPSVAKQITLHGADIISTNAATNYSKTYLANNSLTSQAKKRVIVTIDQFNTPIVSDLVVDNGPLLACMQNSHFVRSATKVLAPTLTKISRELAIDVLPSNADFSKLSRQQVLLKSRKFLSIDGDVLNYDDFQGLEAKDKCKGIQPADKLYAYCSDRKQDGKTEYEREKAILKWKAN